MRSLVCFILLLSAFGNTPQGFAQSSSQDEMAKIDAQIEELKDLQDKYRSSMKRHADNALRWQFQNENYLDARRAWDQAAQDKQKIQEIQDQIDDLENRKKKLAEEHGADSASP